MDFTQRTVSSAQTRQTIRGGDGFLCAKCGKSLYFATEWISRQVVPAKLGGRWDTSNCIILCHKCNGEIGQDDNKSIPMSELPYYLI